LEGGRQLQGQGRAAVPCLPGFRALAAPGTTPCGGTLQPRQPVGGVQSRARNPPPDSHNQLFLQHMTLIDTHTHLYLEEFGSDIGQVLERAAQQGVEQFYLPNIDCTSIEGMLQLEQDYPGRCFAMMGLHPCSVNESVEQELQLVEEWLGKRSFAAIGEIGLDYYWDKTHIPQQIEAFERQIRWAKELKRPVVIHSRDSLADCIRLVEQHQDGTLTGIFHCFGGSVEEARQIAGLGFLMGIGGVLTYKKSGLAETLTAVPLEHLVLETDAPYLTPVPFRGKRNEPAYLSYICRALAAAKGCTEAEIARVTTTNARKLFGG